ncbi:hypothetical protein NDU88_005980 [Pleurodeles waltl]|uniref:Uncharacterized protein n=1 Tax=Pleurodeles waltl TaxID=8319 RepID=A0AAV7PJL0_PLEWA|nr:hypothetical protein NDU88_005980 [Pleurodeles waltl]
MWISGALERRRKTRANRGRNRGPKEELARRGEEDDWEDEEILERHEQRRHIPVGVWLTQVRAYFRVNLLPKWMQVGKERERASGEPGRDREEGMEERGNC